jgi:hypothetical protein
MNARPVRTILKPHSARGPVPQWSARHSHEGCRDARGTGAALPAPRQGRSTPGRHGRWRISRTFLLSTVPGSTAAVPANLASHNSGSGRFVSSGHGR